MRALALLAALLSVELSHAARTYTITIGSDVGRSNEIPLRYARRDAALFARALRQLGGVQAQDLVLLEEPTDVEVRRALEAVNQRVGAADPEDSVFIVYYSGHADAHGLHLGEDSLSYADLKALVSASPAKARVLILDGCRAGGLTRVKGARKAETFSLKLEDNLAVEGLAVMTSSAAGEDSHESERLRGSFFTHHLLAALKGAGDMDKDEQVTLGEAYAYAYKQTLRSSGQTPNLQHPTYSYDIKGRGELVLTRLEGGASSGRLRLGAPATWLVRAKSEGGPLVSEITTEVPYAVLVLPPGGYFIQERHADHYKESSITLPPNGELAMSKVPSRRVAYAQLVRKGGARGRSHGLFLQGGAGGAALKGRGPDYGLSLGYLVDLPKATLSLRGRASTSEASEGGAESEMYVVGLGLGVARIVDLPWSSVGLGLFIEGLHLEQRYAEAINAEDRGSWGLGFGVLGSWTLPLSERLAARLEGGAITQLLSLARVENGTAVGAEVTSRLTWRAGLGLEVRL